MRYMCSWCQTFFADTKIGDERISHGICKACLKKYFGEEEHEDILQVLPNGNRDQNIPSVDGNKHIRED